MEHTKHLWRVFLLLLVFFVAGVCARTLVIPTSFGEEGFYRYDALKEMMGAEVRHGGAQSCVACHQEIADAKAAGAHAAVSCEVCHAPLSVHANAEAKTADMPVNHSYTLCALCHQKIDGRPDAVSQVDIPAHVAELDVVPKGEAIPDGTCIVCHDVHAL